MSTAHVPCTDEEIATACHYALTVHSLVPHLQIQIAVDNGWVTLDGQVSAQYQRAAAEQALKKVAGIIGVTDRIEVKPPVSTSEIRNSIEAAFKHIAEVDARGIVVEVRDNKVTLRGTVSTHAEKAQALKVASMATGVSIVEDDLRVATS